MPKRRERTGFAYEGYLRLKIASVLDDVIALLLSLCGFGASRPERAELETLIRAWAESQGIASNMAPLDADGRADDTAEWVRFLLAFDSGYRQRRLRFAIRTVNHLYPGLGRGDLGSVTTADLDSLKAGLYDTLDLMTPLKDAHRSLPTKVTDQIKAHLRKAHDASDKDREGTTPPATALENIEGAIHVLGEGLSFEQHAERAEAVLSSLTSELPETVRRTVLEAYIGFAAWDVLTFSVTNWRDLDEFNEIRVDRVSPDDAQTLRPGGTSACLKGQQFNHFGAFFSRAYRENDYLWGRLHAAERLIDIVVDAARLENAAESVDVTKLKARAFLAILEAETDELPSCETLIAELRGAASVL